MVTQAEKPPVPTTNISFPAKHRKNPFHAIGEYIERMDQVEQIDTEKGAPFIDQSATPTSAHLASETVFAALWAATPFCPPVLIPINVGLLVISLPNTYILAKRAIGARRIPT